MSLTKRSQSYFFSSAAEDGAQNISLDGCCFTVQLDEPIGIPREAVEAELSVTSAQIWWTVSNISVKFNNNKLYLYSDWIPAPAGSPNWVITLPDGLYSVITLNTAIAREISNLGLPSNLVVIGGDDATQKIVVTFNGGGNKTYFDFTPADTFRDILGFDAREVPALANQSTDGYTELGDNLATFNTIDSFLINTDLISSGIPTNNNLSGTIAKVVIDEKPGALITFDPFNPSVVSARELIGRTKNAFTFRLTDQNYNLVDTNQETWSIVIKITYEIPTHVSASSGKHAGSYG